MHSIVHKYAPSILHEEWQTNAVRNPNIDLRNRDDLYVPAASSEQAIKLPAISFAKMWNDLPVEKRYPNPVLFKNCIKEHLWNIINLQT
jgi:hypothetical protein